ncbi:MAG TPA: hypothetical protein VGP24_12555 [Glaciihabitans sp.]|jgi:DNA-binding transcriptional MerR regulator|nr:hypothetical protein [Glaciihabitans sp.]
MTNNLTAGEFQALTGLAAKALRLYGEREIVTPAFVDPSSGYRYYAPTQIQHGVLVDLLRRARVPLTELASASDFSFERWRETVALNRHLEDFYLQVAERITNFDAADFVARSSPAPAVDWVGVTIELVIPEGAEDKKDAFEGLAVYTPALERAFIEAFSDLEIATSPVSWSVVPDVGRRNGNDMMQLAWAVLELPASDSLDSIAAHVRSATGRSVEVVSGTLPQRLEVTFVDSSTSAPTPVDEASAGYLHALAFQNHIAQHNLSPIRHTARQVSLRGPLFEAAQTSVDGLVNVFDVNLPD